MVCGNFGPKIELSLQKKSLPKGKVPVQLESLGEVVSRHFGVERLCTIGCVKLRMEMEEERLV